MMPDMQNLGLRWRQIRFNPLRSLTPERLASALDSAAAGWLREAALIYESIELREAVVGMRPALSGEVHLKTVQHLQLCLKTVSTYGPPYLPKSSQDRSLRPGPV